MNKYFFTHFARININFLRELLVLPFPAPTARFKIFMTKV